MGSRSSSSTDQTITSIDKRVAVNSGLGISGDSNSVVINSLDGGALKVAADATKTAITENGKTTLAALTAMKDSSKNAFDFGTKVFDTAFEAMGEVNNSAETKMLEAMKMVNGNAAAAMSQVAGAWNDAKAAADGKSLGDFKWVLAGVALVALAMIWKGAK